MNYIFFRKFSLAILFMIILIFLNSCGNNFFRGADARKVSPDPRERVKKNLEEGKGFRLNDVVKKGVGRVVEPLNLQAPMSCGELH